jgi:DNA-binding NarL/FixJ family response regulator
LRCGILVGEVGGIISSFIRILLVDDRTIVRTGLRVILDKDPDLQVVGEASDSPSALRKVYDLRPNVVLIDALSHTIDAVGMVTALALRNNGKVPGVLLLANEVDEYARRVFQAGAKGLVLSRSTPGQLLSAIRIVAAGYWVAADAGLSHLRSRDESWKVAASRSPAAPDEAGLGRLTRREKEVLRLLARGFSNAEISTELVLSESTVKSHIQHLLEKLELRNRVHAVIYAYERGLVASAHPRFEPQRADDPPRGPAMLRDCPV